MKVLKNKIIYTGNGKIDNGYVRFNQRISEVDEMRNFVPQEDDEIIETDATYVIPGFVDVHSHGGYGKDSMDASVISGKPFIQSRDFSLVGFCHSFTFFVFWLEFGCLICNKDTIFLSFCKRIFVLSLFIIALWVSHHE